MHYNPHVLDPPENLYRGPTCTVCGEQVWPDDSTEVRPDEYVCEDCIHEYAVDMTAEVDNLRSRYNVMVKKLTMGMQ